VSTDKAANPVNMMGASKRIMEMFLMYRSVDLPVSMTRFVNAAFSDGSLLYGFNRRIEKEQPLSFPSDVCRYFVTQQEAGELCLMPCLTEGARKISRIFFQGGYYRREKLRNSTQTRKRLIWKDLIQLVL